MTSRRVQLSGPFSIHKQWVLLLPMRCIINSNKNSSSINGGANSSMNNNGSSSSKNMNSVNNRNRNNRNNSSIIIISDSPRFLVAIHVIPVQGATTRHYQHSSMSGVMGTGVLRTPQHASAAKMANGGSEELASTSANVNATTEGASTNNCLLRLLLLVTAVVGTTSSRICRRRLSHLR